MKKLVLVLISAFIFATPVAFADDNMDQNSTASSQAMPAKKTHNHKKHCKSCGCADKHSKNTHKHMNDPTKVPADGPTAADVPVVQE